MPWQAEGIDKDKVKADMEAGIAGMPGKEKAGGAGNALLLVGGEGFQGTCGVFTGFYLNKYQGIAPFSDKVNLPSVIPDPLPDNAVAF